MTITIPTPTKSWLLYLVLVGAVVAGIWLWRDTATKDQKIMADLVKQAQSSQKAADKQALDEVNAANADLQSKNTSLKKQLADAKTVQQQIQLVNKLEGTSIQAQTPSVPDAPIPVTPQDIQVLAVNGEQCAEDKNQVAADQITISAQRDQLVARDNTIASQQADIKTLKGSHLKRFLTTLKWVSIGVATGVVVDKTIGH